MAYDSARGKVVLFGGPFLNDTWGYDGKWTRLDPPTSPPRLTDHLMTYDSTRGVVVLYGGATTEPVLSAATWEYDGTTWTEIGTPGSPRGQCCGMAYDAARRRVVLLTSIGISNTWEYDGTTWTQVTTPNSPPGRLYPAMTYDAARGVIVLFGGSDPGYAASLADTWEYDGTTWTEVVSPASPPGRCLAAMAYDSARGVAVLFGGYEHYGGAPVPADTWEYDGRTWSRVVTPDAPSGRARHAMVYDAERGGVVLFGGGENAESYNDTWEYYGP
jgi:hypothetical protein